MRSLVASDNGPLGGKVRAILLRQGYECPAADVVALDAAGKRLVQAPPDLLVIVLSPEHPAKALALLPEARFLGQGHVLLVGPAANSQLVLQVLRAGGKDYVDEDNLEAELQEALQRFGAERGQKVRPGRVISILAASGGSGSSTLAVNIATVLAKEHKTSLLVDLKLGAGDLAPLLDVKPKYSLADLCQNITQLDRTMFDRLLVGHESGVHLLTAPQLHADVGYVTSEGTRHALTLGRGMFPYVIVDLDHSFAPEQVEAMSRSDLILLVLRLEFTSLRNTHRTLDRLSLLGIARDKLVIVANRYGQPKEVAAARAEEALGMRIAHYVPDDARTINRANNNGVPAVLDSPRAKVSRSLTRLAISVNGHSGKS